MILYDLEFRLEELQDDGDYQYLVTSPDLPNLLVVGDTADEVLSLAPQVAGALIASMRAAGDPLPASVRTISALPFAARMAIAA